MLFTGKQDLAHLYFLNENESLQHCLSWDMRDMATFLGPEGHFFQTQGPSPRFRRCRKQWDVHHYPKTSTAQKTFSIKGFFSKCDQIRSFLLIRSHLLKKSLMENFFFYAVHPSYLSLKLILSRNLMKLLVYV